MPKNKVKMEYALSRDALLRNEIDLVHISTCGSGPQKLLTCICHHQKVQSLDDFPIVAKHKRSAINGKRSHFAHSGKRTNEGEDERLYYENINKINETIIHKEAKKIIASLPEIQLFKMGDPYLFSKFKSKKDLNDNLFKVDLPNIKIENIYSLKVLDAIEEKEINTSLGNFKPDILLTVEDYENNFHCNKGTFLLGIEIFVTSGINEGKKLKIKLADLNTVEIRLNSIYKHYKDNKIVFDYNDTAQIHKLRIEILRELALKNLTYIHFNPDPNDNSYIYNNFNESYTKKLNQHNSNILLERTEIFDYVIYKNKPLFSSDATLKQIYSCPCCNHDVKTNNNIFFEHLDSNYNCFNNFTKETFSKNALNKLLKFFDPSNILNFLEFKVDFVSLEPNFANTQEIILKVKKNNQHYYLYMHIDEIKNYFVYSKDNLNKESIKNIFKRFNYFNEKIINDTLDNPILIGKNNNNEILFLNEENINTNKFICYECNDLLNCNFPNNKIIVKHSNINNCSYYYNYEKYNRGMVAELLKKNYSELKINSFIFNLTDLKTTDIEYILTFNCILLEKESVVRIFKNINFTGNNIEEPKEITNFIAEFKGQINKDKNKEILKKFKHVEPNSNCPICGITLNNYAHPTNVSCSLFQLTPIQINNIENLKSNLLHWMQSYKQFIGNSYCIKSDITKKMDFCFILKNISRYDNALRLDIISNKKEYSIWLWIYDNPHIKTSDIAFIINEFYLDLNVCFEKNLLVKFL